MNADEWLAAFAEALGVTTPDADTIEVLLEIAASAAHASERVAAPIACYVVGLSRSDLTAARSAARSLEEK